MLNDLFAHLQNVSKVSAPATREFPLPIQVRNAWIRDVLLKNEALDTMNILEGPTDTSQSKDSKSGSVTLRSLKNGPNEPEFQDITIHASWSTMKLDAGKITHRGSTVRITHTDSGAEIAVLTDQGCNLPESSCLAKTIYAFVKAKTERVAAA